jgi:hypothetical protein
MAACLYCGQNAGIFRSEHQHCRELHAEAVQKIPEFFVKALTSDLDAGRFHQLVLGVASTHYVREPELNSMVIAGLSAAISSAFVDRRPTLEESARLVDLIAAFGLTTQKLGKHGDRLVKAIVLDELDQGKISSHFRLTDVTIHLDEGETVLWAFVGNAMAPGKDEADDIAELVVTDRNVYYLGDKKTFKIPLKNVLSWQVRDPGFWLTASGTRNKPIIMNIPDPQFAAELMTRVCKLQ